MIVKDNTPQEEVWKLARKGRMTDSVIYKLESKGSGTMFGKGALTFIQEIACDAYTLFEDRNVQTYSMMMGKVNEPEAFSLYAKLIGFAGLEYFGGGNPVFKEYGEHGGGSPDVTAPMPNGTVSFGGELKCPDRDTHWAYLTEIKDQYDLQKISPQYYGQCQGLMRTFGCDLWHWFSYNSFFPLKDRGHLIEVKKDMRWRNNMDARWDMAVKLKIELIEQMKNR